MKGRGSRETVDVWLVRAHGSVDAMPGLARLLSEEERVDLDEYADERQRAMFVFSHAVRRIVLASYLGADPRLLRFAHGTEGKPRLARPSGPPDLEFNVSHSGGWLAIAVARHGSIGVDIERKRQLSLTGIASGVLTTRERLALAALPERARLDWFFDRWVTKESIMKATGAGLSLDPSHFEIEAAGAERHCVVASRSPRVRPGAHTIHQLDMPHGLSGALAVEGGPVEVSMRLHAR